MIRREGGMTLIEILIVLVVIAIVAAIAVPSMLTAVQRSKRSRAMAEIKGVFTSLGEILRKAELPEVIEDVPLASLLEGADFKGPSKDPWGGDYLVTIDRDKGVFRIKSLGRDRVIGTSDGEFDADILFENGQFIAPASTR